MHVDHAVITGTKHAAVAETCQDWCMAQMLDTRRAVAVVADGCSTGAQTDLGARIWGLAAMKTAREFGLVGETSALFQAALLNNAQVWLDQLEPDDGFATVGLLQVEGNQVEATFWGDGALLARHLDGRQTLVNIQYTANAPAYLNYLRNPNAMRSWANAYPRQEVLVIKNVYDEHGELETVKTETLPAGAGPWRWSGLVERDQLELVLVATDGVASRREGFVATTRQLLAVKSAAGEFMRRRLGRQAAAWAKDDDTPGDDLAVAGVWLGA